MSNIAAVPSHVAGDTFTAGMWTTLQQNLNDGVVNQVCAARVYSTNNFNTTSTLAPIPFNSERYDGDNIHSTTTNTSYLTCQTAGIYHIGGCIEFPVDTGANRASIALRVNGTTWIARSSTDLFTGGPCFLSVSCDYQLSVGDYVELCASSLSALAVQADNNMSPEFWMHRI